MPLTDLNLPPWKAAKSALANWDNFRKGLNTLLKPSEIGEDELSKADNVVLIGRGVPTKRWGYKLNHMGGFTGSVRGMFGLNKSDGTKELLTITDDGYLTIQNNASYTDRAGASWASGNDAEMTQLDDKVYIVNGQRELVKYDTPNLTGFPTLAQPTSVFATQLSGASGLENYSYRITTKGAGGGETLGTTAYVLGNQPYTPDSGTVLVQWSGISAASIDFVGYNIYGRGEGNERFLGSVDRATTQFFDDGTAEPAEFVFPPTADSTGGLIAKYIIRFEDRLIYAGIDGEPSKVVISGRQPLQEKNDLANGGNFINIEPDAGDDITGLAAFGKRIIVFKENSIWQITLDSLTVSNFVVTIPTPQLITASRGCISHRSIVPVENDIFFLSRAGVYVLGYEPNIALDILRTNELSAKIRPDFDGVSVAEKKNASATYFEFKYIVSFPGRNETFVYDRERLSWVGPWTLDSNIFLKYYDSADDELLLYGDDDTTNVHRLDKIYGDDNGTTIVVNMTTRDEDFKNFSLFKIIKDIYFNFRNVTGTVSVVVTIEDKNGDSVAEKSFTISTTEQEGNAGWGADIWANTQFGDSEVSGGAADVKDIVRWVHLYKLGRRVKFTISTSKNTDNFELLNIRTSADPAGKGIKGSDWLV